MRFSTQLGLLLLSLISSDFASASEVATDPKPSTLLFSSHEPLSMTLSGPWKALAADRASEPEWRDATLTLDDGSIFSVRAMPRGKSRRQKKFCKFPPVRLDFKRSEGVGSEFEGQNKLKLVTHCDRLGSRSKAYSDRLHSEYLLYRILNILTPMSFRVRMLSIEWQDINSKKTFSHPGFLIEHKKSLAGRLNATLIEQQSIQLSDLAADYSATTALFAYFAGNTDFAPTSGPAKENCCHNMVPLGLQAKNATAHGAIVTIPYDFDATGFVNPPYAAPLPNLGIASLKQRLHRGFCTHNASVPQAVDLFVAAQAEILELLTNYPAISDSRRKGLLRFANKFFVTISNPKDLQGKVLNRCR